MIRFLLIAILLAVVVFQIQGEKVPINEGAGLEGVPLRIVAEGFTDQFDDEGYDAFVIHRILPYALVNSIFVIFDFDMDPESLLHGILIFNFLILLLGCYWYFKLTKKLRSSVSMEILGFVLLFGNFLVLKISWYEAFHPGLFALVLGIGQANYFIRYEKTKLFLVSLIGGFVWPTLFPIGMVLIFLPSDKIVFRENENSLLGIYLIPTVLCCVLTLIGVYFTGTEHGVIWFGLGLLTLASMVYFGLNASGVSWIKSFQLLQKRMKPERLAYLATSVAVYFLIISLLSVGKSEFGIVDFLKGIAVQGAERPLMFLISQFAFYGILIPIILVFFSRICREAGKLGLGFMVVFILIMILVFYADAYWWVQAIPFMVLLVLKGLRRYSLVNKDIWVLSLLSLLLSKFWFKINVEDLDQYILQNTDSWIAQRYFQHFGLMQSELVYYIYIIVFLAASALIFLGKKRYAKS
ncbi:hypothetical protein [Arthrospiribacter ruber]|uniref:Uncharacterized protein n=1 Tax=Arthrospiribacter ruber TaxID=2487934 RepID=A0A951IVL2_9BACT|nr:hypothetical protein [Arthrospiribacter ruber]MBW3466699.1 hypothetical protein [Arthrospiribacter ruber]